jgi:hypothetical protein
MENRILSAPPKGSELQRWCENGIVREPHGSNIVMYGDPDDQYRLTVEVDDPVHGYLIRLYSEGDERIDHRIGQTVVDDAELALQVAAEMAAAADDLAAVDERPSLGPDHVYEEDVERGTVDTPDEWDDEEDEWKEALEEAYEEADLVRSKGTLTTKTIDGRGYYYLQWREGDSVKSQYVAPVSPAGDDG